MYSWGYNPFTEWGPHPQVKPNIFVPQDKEQAMTESNNQLLKATDGKGRGRNMEISPTEHKSSVQNSCCLMIVGGYTYPLYWGLSQSVMGNPFLISQSKGTEAFESEIYNRSWEWVKTHDITSGEKNMHLSAILV